MENQDRRSFLGSSVAGASLAVLAASAAGTSAQAAPVDCKDVSRMAHERFTVQNSLVMLVDHQTGTVGWVKSQPTETVITGCRVLTRMALDYGMPLVITTTLEESVGQTIKDIQDLAPGAYARRYKRGGQLSCWDDEALKAGVKAVGRKNIIMAGLTTDICLFWAAWDALRLGYKVLVVADACGTTSVLGDQITFDRLRDMGVTVTVVNQAVTELVNNFGTLEGQKAQKIMGDEIISKLYAK